MNTLYTKVLLYAYPNIESLIDQIDELIEKKALCSMETYVPCEDICNSIIKLIREKDMYISLMVKIDDILDNLSQDERKCIEYKYFRVRSREKFEGFDYTSKQYFRKQNKLLEKLKKRFEKKGINDELFKREYLEINFFKSLLRRVKERESLIYKNRKKVRCEIPIKESA